MKSYDILLWKPGTTKTYKMVYLATSAGVAARQAEYDYPGWNATVTPHHMIVVGR